MNRIFNVVILQSSHHFIICSLKLCVIMKQCIKKILPGVMICFPVTACSLTELGVVQKDQQNGVWNGPYVPPPVSSQSIAYVSAFDYPDGYDWRADPERGAVKCSLVVFQEGVPILKVPVGEEYHVSPDPDMHRIVDGHLYTDFSTDTHTYIKKDGKPLFSYQGAEMICDFEVLDGEVHTLGHSRSGSGFSYRVNGTVVLERNDGYTFERISFDDSVAVIPFAETITSVEGTLERYYVMMDGKVMQVALREDIKKVWDIACKDGEVYYLASLTGLSLPVLISGEKMLALSMPSSQSLVSCRMDMLSGGICVEGVLSDHRQIRCVLWDAEGKYILFPKGMTYSAFCPGERGMHCAMNPVSDEDAGLIYRDGESLKMPYGYKCMGRSAMDFASGILSVGLSSSSGGKPALWVDGQLRELDVEGYISCVASSPV